MYSAMRECIIKISLPFVPNNLFLFLLVPSAVVRLNVVALLSSRVIKILCGQELRSMKMKIRKRNACLPFYFFGTKKVKMKKENQERNYEEKC